MVNVRFEGCTILIDEDDDEEPGVISVDGQYQKVSKARLQELSDEIGKTNTQGNPYTYLLKRGKIYEDEGLTAEFYLDTFTGNWYVTSEEYKNNRMN